MEEPNKTQQYANELYAYMLENSDEVVFDGRAISRWRGSITKTCRELGIPKGVDRRITRPLEEMGCIEILQRGVRNYPTVIALLDAPTEDKWADQRDRVLTGRPSLDRLAREMGDIRRTLGGVNLNRVLGNFESRISKIESELKKLKESR